MVFCPKDVAKGGLSCRDQCLNWMVLLPPVGLSQRRCLELSWLIFWQGMWKLAMKWKLEYSTAGWGNLVSLFHLYITSHLTQEFLLYINTKQDWSSGQRECIVFYFNEGFRLMETSIWSCISQAEHLLQSEVGCGKEESVVNWELAASSSSETSC